MTESDNGSHNPEKQAEGGLWNFLKKNRFSLGALGLLAAGTIFLGKSGPEETPSEKDKQAHREPNEPNKPNSRLSIQDDSNMPQSSLPEGYARVEMPPIPSIYSSLEPIESCDIDTEQFRSAELLERFGMVIKLCRGKMQSNGRTALKSTIPGYKPNSEFNNSPYALSF